MALGLSSYRPSIMGTKHAISSGHYLATSAGYRILEQGGNAIDAGVAAGLAMMGKRPIVYTIIPFLISQTPLFFSRYFKNLFLM